MKINAKKCQMYKPQTLSCCVSRFKCGKMAGRVCQLVYIIKLLIHLFSF